VPSIAIVTCADDLHALVIRQRLESLPDTSCAIIETDTLAGHPNGLTWSTDEDSAECTVPTRDGGRLDVASCDAIWFRRWNHPQRAGRELTDRAHVEVINQSCTATLLGALLNTFGGVWVSRPEATRRAENKLVQLRAAQTAGFSVPRTLVSQDPDLIRAFCAGLDGPAVMKSVQATPRSQLYTIEVRDEHVADDDGLRLCPTIFQEYVPGSFHLRVLCCGGETHAVTIESGELDWRMNLDVPISPVKLDPLTQQRINEVLDLLELQMGVIDLKIGPDGQPVWLELNPQGQFLFVEGLTGMDLAGPFSEFLYREAQRASS
jgi:glutathione synthase/RimK-type ligase-like ATP-grasp enzyme